MIDIKSLVDNYSKEALENITLISNSMAELVRNLGYKTQHGKNYETVKKRLEQYNISTDHFVVTRSNRSHSKDDVFCENSIVGQKTLRAFYIKQDDVEYKCAECGIGPIWNGVPLTLQLDHVDGNNKNNLLSNLRWLCPNCHSQTRTFAGKNVQKERQHYYCVDCGKEINKNFIRCSKCAAILRRKTERPSEEELKSLLKSHNGSFKYVAHIYNVSDNTIRKWCKYYGLPTHTKDYQLPIPKKEKNPVVIYAVDQIDMKTGEIIASFKSQKEAERVTGIYHINAASDPNNTKRKSAGGYYWRRK